jgi:hypothetical protein
MQFACGTRNHAQGRRQHNTCKSLVPGQHKGREMPANQVVAAAAANSNPCHNAITNID